MKPPSRLPHPHQHAPLVHPARPGAAKINLQLLAAAFVRAVSRRPREIAPAPVQLRLEEGRQQ